MSSARRAIATLIVACAAGAAVGQEAPLGDVARREQARRAQSPRAPSKATPSYTDQDLETIRSSELRGNLNVIGSPAEGSSQPQVQEGAQQRGEPEGPASGSPRGEDAWRQRGADLRTAMANAQQRLQSSREEAGRLRERLSPVAATYLQDVNERLRLESELTAAEAAAAQAERELEQSRRAFRELQDEAQRQRIPPGWISPAS